MIRFSMAVCTLVHIDRAVQAKKVVPMVLALKRVSFIFFMIFASINNSAARGGEDPWTSDQVVQPQDLAAVMKSAPKERQPILLHVGFQFLYKNGHLPDSLYVGPANEESGLSHLRAELKDVPRTREIVIYCGCCPLKKCPNVRPAFKTVQAMGFKNVKVLYLQDNLEKNWIEKGYPVEKR